MARWRPICGNSEGSSQYAAYQLRLTPTPELLPRMSLFETGDPFGRRKTKKESRYGRAAIRIAGTRLQGILAG
jgi:hypothetical protein